MDDYGVAAAALAGLTVYSQASRGTGRTMRMIASLKGGETVVCSTQAEARHVEERLRLVDSQRASRITVVTAPSIGEAVSRNSAPYVFTETFVERAFLQAVERTAGDFASFGVRRMDERLPAEVVPSLRFER